MTPSPAPEPPRELLYTRLLHLANPLVRALLRSPLHGLLSARLALVTLEGRRSGRRISFPVGYNEFDDCVLVLISQTSTRSWWRNFREPWPSSLRIRGREVEVIGRFLPPGNDAFREAFERVFRALPMVARIFDTDFDPERGLTDAQLQALADDRGVVRFERGATGRLDEPA